MEEKTLLRISLIVGLVGVVLLYFISSGLELQGVKAIDALEEDKEVTVKGKIGKLSVRDKVVFLEIYNEKIEKVPVVLFKEGDIMLQKGDYVEISGTVEEYQGKKGLIGNKVVKK